MVKIDLKELKKAIQWVEVNTNDISINLFTGDGNKLVITCFDKGGSEVEITLFTDSQMLPKIKKTEVLR